MLTGRPVSAERVRQIRPSSASKAGRSTRPQSIHSKQQHKQRQQRYKQPLGDSSNQHTSVSHSAAIHRPLSPVQECSHEPLFADDLLASAARLSSRSSGDWQQGMPSSAVMAPTAATVAGNEERGFGSLSAEQVQDIEQQVQQQLQQEKQQEEAIRYGLGSAAAAAFSAMYVFSTQHSYAGVMPCHAVAVCLPCI